MTFNVVIAGDRKVAAQFDAWPAELHDALLGRIRVMTLELEARVRALAPGRSGKLKSEIIANIAHPAPAGERGWGWSQASFISFRPDLSRAAALAHWHGHHTRVAIETQANFLYRQNLIVAPLTPDAPAYDAFVEECFPAAAMTDPAAFFAAEGDPARLEANVATMMDSCQGFIDFTRIDIIPTSWYAFGERE